ncbi:MAG: hypothetical protein HYV95_11435 [Opitutae bacterium]|nr:hypothetical protein [Opitutae bacterium]
MSGPFTVNLLQLNGDATAYTGPGQKIELKQQTADEILVLAGNLQKLDLSGQTKAEPAIIIHRGEKGWRIMMQDRRLRLYESTSVFDNFDTVNTPQELRQFAPFYQHGRDAELETASTLPAATGFGWIRTAAEVGGLIIVGLALMAVGLWFGLPHRKLGDVPEDISVISSSDERQKIFATFAGTYSTGKKAGDSVLIIAPDGQVTLGSIGKDGKPILPPHINEKAQAGRRKEEVCVVTTFGVIDPGNDAVAIGNLRWRRLAVN